MRNSAWFIVDDVTETAMRRRALIAVGAVLGLTTLTTLTSCDSGPPVSTHATIAVNTPVALADRAVHITIDDLTPGETVTVTATAPDFAGDRWQSHATFRADSHGSVDLSQAAPLSGTYSGVDGMGLFWSMNAPPHDPDPQFFQPAIGSLLTDGTLPPLTVDIAVTAQGTRLATRTLTREWLATGVTGKPVTLTADGVSGQLFLPPMGTPRHPGVLIFGGSEGGDSQVHAAALLASHGYPALSVAYFHAPGLPGNLQNIPLEYFAKAARLLAAQPGVDAAHLVVCGYSRGTEAALLLGADYPSLVHGVIVYSPTDIVYRGLPDGYAWTYQGKPLQPRVLIPVTSIRGPVLAIAGGDDMLWPSVASTQTMMTELTGDRYSHQGLIYPAAGHLVGTFPYMPMETMSTSLNGQVLLLGGSRAGDDAAQARGWPRVLAFLASQLRPCCYGPAVTAWTSAG